MKIPIQFRIYVRLFSSKTDLLRFSNFWMEGVQLNREIKIVHFDHSFTLYVSEEFRMKNTDLFQNMHTLLRIPHVPNKADIFRF